MKIGFTAKNPRAARVPPRVARVPPRVARVPTHVAKAPPHVAKGSDERLLRWARPPRRSLVRCRLPPPDPQVNPREGGPLSKNKEQGVYPSLPAHFPFKKCSRR